VIMTDTIQAVTGVVCRITVHHRNGHTEEVDVLEIPFKDSGKFLSAGGDEVAQACLYTGRPREWIESLTRDSAEEIVMKGGEANLPFLERCLQRQARFFKLAQKLELPGFSTNALPPPTPLPTSPPPPDSGSTNSAK
jgi:hypothetical protein